MEKTLFIASFPDLSCFDLGRSGIDVCDIDNSDYFFSSGSSKAYIKNYIESLKERVGSCEVIFVPAIDKVITSLEDEGIKCIVLYPNIELKDMFIDDLYRNNIDPSYISMISSSWDFIIKKLDKHDYDYKYMMGEDDTILDVLRILISKKDVLGVSQDDITVGNSEVTIDKIFDYCLLNQSEMEEDKARVQSVYCEGVNFDFMFSTKRLSEKSSDISAFIDNVRISDNGVSFSNLNVLNDGSVWTEDMNRIEKCFALGVANGDLEVPFPRDMDYMLKGKVPHVIKNKELKKTA